MSRRITITSIISKDDFVTKAKEIYKENEFDYSLIAETFKKTERLSIICSKHGKFVTTYYKFIDKAQGCKECKKEELKEGRRLHLQEEFIKESTKVHNGFYNYDKVYYQGNNEKVIIICPIHGEFEQTPHDHKSGGGCKECARIRLVELNRNTTETFIKKANQIHNNFYDYSKSVYMTANDKLTIICPIHGEFEMLASSHLRGCDCPECANKKKGYGKGNKPKAKTTEQFIRDSKEIFGDAYNYSKTHYINARTPVIITCPIHGDFSVVPNKHLSAKRGCPKCIEEKIKEKFSKTTEEFIEQSKKIFGDYYDYSKTHYINNKTKVTISCLVHGDFEINPMKHIYEHQGCPECGKMKSAHSNRNTIEDFIRIGNSHFHGFYDYSETVFTDIKSEVDIICPIHGKFKTMAYSHMRGDGECPHCVKERQQRSFEEFVEAANKIYKGFYDYSEADYVDNNTEIKVICPIHGPFFVTPQKHLRTMSGCPRCKSTDIEKMINGMLTKNNIEFEIQKTFEWLKFKKNMYLDFYIDSIKVAIECHGPQHFKVCEFFGYNEDTFELYKKRDREKNKLCLEHGIKILYFATERFVDNYELGYLYTNVEDIMNIISEELRKIEVSSEGNE